MYTVDRMRIAGENGWRVVLPMTSLQARLASIGIRKQKSDLKLNFKITCFHFFACRNRFLSNKTQGC
jgi:hypothetical protein